MSSNLSLLVARQSLRMSKKTKASNVCSCVCVVLMHEPGENEWLKANFLRHCLPGAPGRGSVEPCHAVHGALIGFPHILLTYLEKGLEVITTTKNESSHPKMCKSLQVIFDKKFAMLFYDLACLYPSKTCIMSNINVYRM